MKIADQPVKVGRRRQRRHILIVREKLVKALVRKGADESTLHGLTQAQLANLLQEEATKLTKIRIKERSLTR